MNQDQEVLLEKIHAAYKECKDTFVPTRELLNIGYELKDPEEAKFFGVITSFFIQQKQKELLERDAIR